MTPWLAFPATIGHSTWTLQVLNATGKAATDSPIGTGPTVLDRSETTTSRVL